MQVMTAKAYGDAQLLKLDTLEDPHPRSGQVLIRNFATSVNPVDWKVRGGQIRLFSGLLRPPKVLGGDFAGEVLAVAEGVTAFRKGDKVYGFVNPFKGGAYAEQLCARAANIARIPEGLSFVEAATLPIAALTAYQSLFKLGQIKSGQRVLINGCSGGVGVMALQMAKAEGAWVTGVCSARNRDLALSLGADEVIDYQSDPSLSSAKSCDIFFDVVANKRVSSVASLLNRGGRYITTLPDMKTLLLSPVLNLFSQSRSYGIMVKPSQTDLQAINRLIEQKKLITVIEKQYQLSEMVAAHQQSEKGHVVGKLAIVI